MVKKNKKLFSRKRVVKKTTGKNKKKATSKKKRVVGPAKPSRKKRKTQRPEKKKIAKTKLSPNSTRYILNKGFEFFNELRDLILKSSPAEKNVMVQKLSKIGIIKLAVISGIFINKENIDPDLPDLFIVADDVDRRKLRSFLKSLEAEVGKELKFALMEKDEFIYRIGMFDRFIRVLLEGPHEKLVNRLGI